MKSQLMTESHAQDHRWVRVRHFLQVRLDGLGRSHTQEHVCRRPQYNHLGARAAWESQEQVSQEACVQGFL